MFPGTENRLAERTQRSWIRGNRIALTAWLLALLPLPTLAQESGSAVTFAKLLARAPATDDAVAQELLLNKAMLSFSAGKYDDAITQFKSLKDPNDIATQYLALSYLEQGDTVASLLALESAASSDKADADFGAGLKHFENREMPAAAAALRAYLDRHPGDDYARLLLGSALIAGQDKEAGKRLVQQSSANEAFTLVAQRLDDLSSDPGLAETYANSPTMDYCADQCLDCEAALADRRWNFTLLTGYQYDSNVVLSPEFIGLGAPTNMSDSSWFVASFGDYRLIQEAEQTVGLIMSTYDNFYFQQSAFDLQDYMLGAYANTVLGCNWIGGIRYEFHETLLGNRQFATEHRLVPNLTYRQGDFGHLTFFYEFDGSDFNVAPLIPDLERSGTVHGLGATQAVYTFGGQGRIFLGYRFEEAFTQGSDFDRTTHMVTARVERPTSERSVVDCEVRQFWDDYQNPNSLDFLGRPREDQRTEVRAGIQYYMGSQASLRLDYTFINSNSNVSNLFDVHFYQYNRHLVTPTFIYDF